MNDVGLTNTPAAKIRQVFKTQKKSTHFTKKKPPHTPMKSGCKASAQYSSPARNKRITARPQCSILSVPPCNRSHYISSLYSSLVQYTSHIQSSTNCRGASTHPWGMFPKEWNYIYLTADISISQPLQLLFTTYTTQHVYYRYVFTVTSLVHPLITDTFFKKKKKKLQENLCSLKCVENGICKHHGIHIDEYNVEKYRILLSNLRIKSNLINKC